jgi:hypothetical protein
LIILPCQLLQYRIWGLGKVTASLLYISIKKYL